MMTTKRFPPGHDHSKDVPPVKKETVVSEPKTHADSGNAPESPRRLPKSFKR